MPYHIKKIGRHLITLAFVSHWWTSYEKVLNRLERLVIGWAEQIAGLASARVM